MRIIGGVAGGRRLKAPDTRGTRPATDRVREAVFSSIGPWVVDASVADLYAGSGSFGLEALSRGAATAVFVENARRALSALRDNIAAVGMGGEVDARPVGEFLRDGVGGFHLVFIDPPWALDAGVMTRQLALLDRLLEPNGEVVLSRRHGDRLPEKPENWRVAAEKRYGDTRILRYTKPESQE